MILSRLNDLIEYNATLTASLSALLICIRRKGTPVEIVAEIETASCNPADGIGDSVKYSLGIENCISLLPASMLKCATVASTAGE